MRSYLILRQGEIEREKERGVPLDLAYHPKGLPPAAARPSLTQMADPESARPTSAPSAVSHWSRHSLGCYELPRRPHGGSRLRPPSTLRTAVGDATDFDMCGKIRDIRFNDYGFWQDIDYFKMILSRVWQDNDYGLIMITSAT